MPNSSVKAMMKAPLRFQDFLLHLGQVAIFAGSGVGGVGLDFIQKSLHTSPSDIP
jgi:hypothetical protein